VVIVGTHADLLKKHELTNLCKEMEALYPRPVSGKTNRSQIQGHFSVSLLPVGKGSLEELSNKIVDIALNHPKIGVGNVLVPKSVELLQIELEKLKNSSPYLKWQDYSDVCNKFGNIMTKTIKMVDTNHNRN
jgi:hypothetical protein